MMKTIITVDIKGLLRFTVKRYDYMKKRAWRNLEYSASKNQIKKKAQS